MDEKNMQTKIGKYDILEKVGEGGYGIVYRGRDPMLDRAVAIKVLRADVATSLDFVERFRREARLAASLRHPNIVNVIEVGEDAGRYFLVMDYLPGGPLSKLLKDGKPLPLSRAVELLKPIAEALDYAHSKGLIHRDVKPSNIIFNEEGKPVLTDFGLVKSLSEESSTTTGMALGTAEYMAPEQILGQELTPLVDLYSFGVIAFQMLAGQVPFSGKSPFEVQTGHASKPLPDPLHLNSHISSQTADAIKQALEKKPEKRFASAMQFVSRLEGIATLESQRNVAGRLQAAQQLMENAKYEEAILSLEEIMNSYPSSQADELLQECRRRQGIWREVNETLSQHKEASSRLLKLGKNEKWLSKSGVFAPADLSFKANRNNAFLWFGRIRTVTAILVLVILHYSLLEFTSWLDTSQMIELYNSPFILTLAGLTAIAFGGYWAYANPHQSGWRKWLLVGVRLAASLVIVIQISVYLNWIYDRSAIYFRPLEFCLVFLGLFALDRIWPVSYWWFNAEKK